MLENEILRLYEHRGVSLTTSKAAHKYPVLEETSDLDSKEKVLVEVFAIDPLTNKPMNDLVLTANQRLDPTIREFIKQNLQAPVEPQNGTSDYGISEELCRRSDESVFEYQQRLRQLSVDGLEYVKSASKKVRDAKSK